MFEKSLSQVTKLETDLTQAKTALEAFRADEAAARGRLADALADAGASKAAIAEARKAVSDLGAAVKTQEDEIMALEAAIPKAREAAIEKAKGEFTAAVQAALDATDDIPQAEILSAMQTVIDLADRIHGAWQNYSATTCTWAEHFPIPTPPHAQPPEKRLNFQAMFIDAAKALHGPVDYAAKLNDRNN